MCTLKRSTCSCKTSQIHSEQFIEQLLQYCSACLVQNLKYSFQKIWKLFRSLVLNLGARKIVSRGYQRLNVIGLTARVHITCFSDSQNLFFIFFRACGHIQPPRENLFLKSAPRFLHFFMQVIKYQMSWDSSVHPQLHPS